MACNIRGVQRKDCGGYGFPGVTDLTPFACPFGTEQCLLYATAPEAVGGRLQKGAKLEHLRPARRSNCWTKVADRRAGLSEYQGTVDMDS